MHNTWQDKITFTPDQLLIGTGWHEVEKQEDTYYRWIGPEPKATIHLYPCRDQENRLNITIHSCTSKEILDGLKILADDTPLSITTSSLSQGADSPMYLTAVLPKDLSKSQDQPTVLTLQAPKCMSEKSLDPSSKTNRQLCLALRRIDIFPLTRALFTAQKYTDPVPFDGMHYLEENPRVKDSIIQGLSSSAYEYYQKNGKYKPRLHQSFDECPGDLYDIIRSDMRTECKKMEDKYQQEITLLREMVHRQGDLIRNMKKK